MSSSRLKNLHYVESSTLVPGMARVQCQATIVPLSGAAPPQRRRCQACLVHGPDPPPCMVQITSPLHHLEQENINSCGAMSGKFLGPEIAACTRSGTTSSNCAASLQGESRATKKVGGYGVLTELRIRLLRSPIPLNFASHFPLHGASTKHPGSGGGLGRGQQRLTPRSR